MSTGSADDIVATHAQAAAAQREPLLVLEPLRDFLDAHGIGSGDLTAQPIGEGHSNVTFRIVRTDGTAVVLRRPPRGPLPPSAHDVVREARLLSVLGPTAARVPTVLAIAEDAGIVGAPFYVMEEAHGAVVTAELPPALDTPHERAAIGRELVDALVEIHGVDWAAAGLEGFGKPTGYLERQLRRFGGLWEHNRTRELPAVERVGAWLAEHLPSSPPATIVHGDYRLGNVMIGDAPPARIVAVFDWEMATIGDPLADLGYLTMLWSQADDPPSPYELSAATRREGFPTRAELVARYEERSGRSAAGIAWYQALALWKAAVFMEGNYRRALEGSTDDPWLRSFGQGVAELAARAEAIVDA